MNAGKKTISNLLSVHCSWPNLFVFSLGKLLFSLKDHMEMIKYFLNKQHLAARLSGETQGRIHLPQSSVLRPPPQNTNNQRQRTAYIQDNSRQTDEEKAGLTDGSQMWMRVLTRKNKTN